MKCRDFEDEMSANFSAVPALPFVEALDEASYHDRWSEMCALYPRVERFVSHLADCPDCTNSLRRYIEIRDKVDYHAYPCFHLAAATIGPDACLEVHEGTFSIILTPERTGIVISHCPWCGVAILSGERPWMNRNPVVEVAPYQPDWVRCPSCQICFCLSDPARWDGWRHQTCGQRIRVRRLPHGADTVTG